ncbi:MAG: 2-C-methyl-D-erythritol 2,4-cyclodiphosphate synthase [Spirochaetales bacterium]|nr:2-C-methyl-D-erythritol 2,4-cyclodiphosphate synthase [Spirochaetales bacterium]
MRIGTGWDLHRLKEGRRLILGGVHIPFHLGEEAHSDGDVLIHAVIDAILGAAALGDIGTLFPPSDKQYKDISSLVLLEQSVNILTESGYQIINLDATVILQIPKLKPYITSIRENLAAALSLETNRISVKAKTKENVDATGEGKAVEALASVLIEEIDESLWV